MERQSLVIDAAEGIRQIPGMQALRRLHLADERERLEVLIGHYSPDAGEQEAVFREACELIAEVRRRGDEQGGLEALLREYDLSSREGVVLMCLAEALLRIPDAATADSLIREKLSGGDWRRHLGSSESLFVNASTWGLMLTGRLVGAAGEEGWEGVLQRWLSASSEPVVRAALREGMRILSQQYVMGPTIDSARERAARSAGEGDRFSFDMLGEAAVTARDALRYQQAYVEAIGALSRGPRPTDPGAADGISVKLSALHPRFEYAQADRLEAELLPRLETLADLAAEAGIGLTIDAEECDRLEPTLWLFERLLSLGRHREWSGLGLAVQAYQKRALAVIQWLAERAAHHGRRITVRLVKGAYWDTEVKRAQQQGLSDYPVFVNKASTDLSYLACARELLRHTDRIHPRFATHNAHTLAAVHRMAQGLPHEFQRLHGMGELLYRVFRARHGPVPCRIYAPVGGYRELLPYLVRRLLENGANTSFVNRIHDRAVPVERIAADPTEQVASLLEAGAFRIPPPPRLYGEAWRNSEGVDLTAPDQIEWLERGLAEAEVRSWRAEPLLAGTLAPGRWREVRSPAEQQRLVGEVMDAEATAVAGAVEAAGDAFDGWEERPLEERAVTLERVADALQGALPRLVWLAAREAGRTLPDGVAEVREAVEFCRYYAMQARRLLGEAHLPGPAGEKNLLRPRGRGPFVAISPWNFPISIFAGQIAAALVAGNPVIAKPAEQSALTAAEVVRIFHAAGVPREVLQFLPGAGETVGAALVADPRIAGVVFTGSTETARAIHRAMAAHDGPIGRLVAETGGINAMIVDSSALPEQVVRDVIRSAFDSAGQRCSALRVLFLQEEIADTVEEMLFGAMDLLRVGDPIRLRTDVGPVIDAPALAALAEHVAAMEGQGRLLHRAPLPPEVAEAGHFIAPCALRLESMGELRREVFGPVLHLVRYRARDLDRVLQQIRDSGYGLTLGIHTRIQGRARAIARRARVGNVYINRDMIGAVVGVQPFGGEGLSGTGPKAGGPFTLTAFIAEQTLTDNIAAIGGDPELLSLKSE